ncbi:unnamed protein product [Peronospora belbahrii]|uniref:Uncharacterized protein n=1 Tax=Peronospora belbahrii TaxID=622444 RepID=A0ABN8D3P7_9STRA|nr:unnamed protein product [Peronospora belbahrii]
MGVRRTAHGSTESDDLSLSLDNIPIPTMTLSQSYTYLRIGDGFDHVQRSLDVLPLLKLLKQDATALIPANTGSGTPTQLLQLRVPHHAGYLEHRNVLRQVRQHMKLLRWKAWCAHKDQGKTARAHGGLGSGFLTRPRGMWGSDYRFDIAARLDMLDTVMFSRVDASVLMLDAGTRAAGGKSRSPMFSTTARVQWMLYVVVTTTI